GYTQGGASPNTASIHSANNAILKIVLTGTNGNGMSMYSAVTNFAGFDYPNLGWADKELAILGFFRSTNAWIKGLCIQSAPHTVSSLYPDPAKSEAKAFCFAPDAPDISGNACQNFHVSGCWFGLDPVTRQVAIMPDGHTVATPHMCVAAYGTGTNGTVVGYTNSTGVDPSGTIGVAAGSTAPRAEFNVCITPYGFDASGGPYRISGNFWGVLPDGVTGADMSDLDSGNETSDAYCEWGGAHDIVIGTDGDGVNDADEGNIFGKYSAGDADVEFYGSQGNMVYAGNTFGADINGKSLEAGQPNSANKVVHKFNVDSTCQVRFGSDFNGVSDALEANLVVDSVLFDLTGSSATNSHWISMRGNSLTNCTTQGSTRPPIGDGQPEGIDVYSQFIDVSTGDLAIIPVIAGGTTTASLMGTCGPPLGAPYTNLVVDLYEADPDTTHPPQGKKWIASFVDNSAADADPAVGAFTFSTAGLPVTSGMKVTITVTYTRDTPPMIASVSRTGTQSTIKISNAGSGTYGIQKSASTSPASWSTVMGAVGGTATFTDTNSPKSFYRAHGPTATGQTSPFSDVYTIP
ncbi:MAG: hypothetical protein NT154_24535, partial [Verrucomicrobia bacterium]|nr:hypothetical protein [Verrucomicrobiota bacterium]